MINGFLNQSEKSFFLFNHKIIPNEIHQLCFKYYFIPKQRGRQKVVRHKPPSDWSIIPSEKAIKWIYEYETNKWISKDCRIKIDEVPFDKGGLRYEFYLKDLSSPNKQYVAKISHHIRDNMRILKVKCFNDLRNQVIARHFCHGSNGYNAYNPPQKVDFLEAFVLNLKQREGSEVCFVERYIDGEYKKYNNSVGWVSEDKTRNTRHAFAHFTYEASKRKLLVDDIQAVNDIYVDPQVHSINNLNINKPFDRGNLGSRGIENFLRTHRCNPICRYLTLPPINYQFGRRCGHMDAHHIIFDLERSDKMPLLSDKGFPKIVDEIDNDQEKTKCWCSVL